MSGFSGFVLDYFDLILLVSVFIFVLTYKWINRQQLKSIVIDGPVILPIYMTGTKLTKLSSGNLGVYPYEILITEPILLDFSERRVYTSGEPSDIIGEGLGELMAINNADNAAGRIILNLHLPENSPVHLAGLGMQDKLIKAGLERINTDNALEPVELEGDFPDYFRLYCDKAHKIELLELIDPPMMAFLIDFCQRTHWEVFGNMAYFSEIDRPNGPTSDSAPDNTTLVQDAQTFVDNIMPELRRMRN